MTDYELMGAALEEAARAAALGEVPVGAVVARNGEIIAAISAAVASVCGGNAVIRGIKRVSKPAAGSRRGAWGDAGVREHTAPFM